MSKPSLLPPPLWGRDGMGSREDWLRKRLPARPPLPTPPQPKPPPFPHPQAGKGREGEVRPLSKATETGDSRFRLGEESWAGRRPFAPGCAFIAANSSTGEPFTGGSGVLTSTATIRC